MLPTSPPVKPSVTIMYAPSEISHEPQTKNCRKFMTVSRSWTLMCRGTISGYHGVCITKTHSRVDGDRQSLE
jgi:hypothetical protein